MKIKKIPLQEGDPQSEEVFASLFDWISDIYLIISIDPIDFRATVVRDAVGIRPTR